MRPERAASVFGGTHDRSRHVSCLCDGVADELTFRTIGRLLRPVFRTLLKEVS